MGRVEGGRHRGTGLAGPEGELSLISRHQSRHAGVVALDSRQPVQEQQRDEGRRREVLERSEGGRGHGPRVAAVVEDDAEACIVD